MISGLSDVNFTLTSHGATTPYGQAPIQSVQHRYIAQPQPQPEAPAGHLPYDHYGAQAHTTPYGQAPIQHPSHYVPGPLSQAHALGPYAQHPVV